MTLRNFKHLAGDALLSLERVEPAQAGALATAPGGCEGTHYPVFLDLAADVELATGDYACFEFILPGRPGRWRAGARVALALPEGTAELLPGYCVEVLGLALSTGAPTPPAAEPAAEETGTGSTSAPGTDPAIQDPAGEATAEPEVAFDAATIQLGPARICGMLSDLLGREVTAAAPLDDLFDDEPAGEDTLEGPDSLLAVYRDRGGTAHFAIVLDKPAAARIGGALTMMDATQIKELGEAPGALGGDPLANATEVLNIMAALFNELGGPHVTLAGTQPLAEGLQDEQLARLLGEPTWQLDIALELEEYGPGSGRLLAG